MLVVDLYELDLRELFQRGGERLRDAEWRTVGLALTLQIDGQDPVVQFDAAITDESIPQRDQAAGLFRCIRTLEVFVHDRADRVD